MERKPRHPKGPPKKTSPAASPSPAEAEAALESSWAQCTERRVLLHLAVWIAQQLPRLESLRHVKQLRRKCFEWAREFPTTCGSARATISPQINITITVAEVQRRMAVDTATGEWWPTAQQPGAHITTRVDDWTPFVTDWTVFLHELSGQYSLKDDGETAYIRATKAVSKFAESHLSAAKAGRPASPLLLFATLMVTGATALRVPLVAGGSELWLLAIASRVERRNTAAPFSVISHRQRWSLLQRKVEIEIAEADKK